MTDSYPKFESGYFHLTEDGWVRADTEPYPAGRIETWKFETYVPAADAKEQVRLVRIWINPGACGNEARARFGNPIMPGPDRNISLECYA